MFNPNKQYNNQDLQKLNNLMGQLQQNYHPNQNTPVQLNQSTTITDKLKEEDNKQQLINDKLNSYINSKDRYEHEFNQPQNYINQYENNNFTGIGAYKHSLNDNNMFQKDLRENINSKMDIRIFENVTDNRLPLISDINDEHNMILNYKPQIQHRSKNLYKQQTNERLNSYSPLSRSAYIPTINTDNINDTQTHKKLSPRDVMNQRLNNFEPLSCNISLKKPNHDNKNITSVNYEQNLIEQNIKYQQAIDDINHIDQGSCNNVVNTHIPVSTTN
jgi:hypothetical protein